MKKNNIWDKYKGILITLIVISILISIYGITYLMFTSNKGFYKGDNLEIRDWLSFWGIFLSFGSSIVFSIIAVWQNNRAQRTNDKILNENRRINQIEFENELKKNEYTLIINGVQNISLKLSDLNKRLVNTVLFNFPNPDNDTKNELKKYCNILIPLITDIQFLREVEIDSILPTTYDEKYVVEKNTLKYYVIKENKAKIKNVLLETEQNIRNYQNNLMQLDGKGNLDCNIKLHIDIPQGNLNEISTYFYEKLSSIDSYTKF